MLENQLHQSQPVDDLTNPDAMGNATDAVPTFDTMVTSSISVGSPVAFPYPLALANGKVPPVVLSPAREMGDALALPANSPLTADSDPGPADRWRQAAVILAMGAMRVARREPTALADSANGTVIH